MEEKNKQEPMTLRESVMQEGSKTKKVPLLILLGVVMVALIVLGYFAIGKENREDALSFIDSILISNDTLLGETEDMEMQFSDLSDDFLDAEVVDTQDVDSSIEELDTQLEALDSLDSDFELEITDVGL